MKLLKGYKSSLALTAFTVISLALSPGLAASKLLLTPGNICDSTTNQDLSLNLFVSSA